MSLTWAHPLFLIAALLLAAGGLALWWRTAKHSRRWRLVVVGLPTVAAILTVAGAAGPVLERSPTADEVVILLDLSGSTRGAPWRKPAWVREFAASRLPTGTKITVAGFAGSVRVLARQASLADAGGWPTGWGETSAEEEGASKLAAALAWREGPADRRPRWVFTDGLLDTNTFAKSHTHLRPPPRL